MSVRNVRAEYNKARPFSCVCCGTERSKGGPTHCANGTSKATGCKKGQGVLRTVRIKQKHEKSALRGPPEAELRGHAQGNTSIYGHIGLHGFIAPAARALRR